MKTGRRAAIILAVAAFFITTICAASGAPALLSEEKRYVVEGGAGKFEVVVGVPTQHDGVAVVVVPGAYGNDVDGNYPSLGLRPGLYGQIAQIAASLGHITARYSRLREDWKAVTTLDAETVDRTLDDRVAALRSVISIVRQQPGVRAILLVAHSEGCLIALRAQYPDVSAVLGVGCPLVRSFDLSLQRVRAYQGTESLAYQALLRATYDIRAGRDTDDAGTAETTYVFGSMSAGRREMLRSLDRIEPCDAYEHSGVSLKLLRAQDDPLSAGSCSGLPAGMASVLPEGGHYMQVVSPSVIPWVAAEPMLSERFSEALVNWLNVATSTLQVPHAS